MESNPLKIIIADDHQILLDGLRAIIADIAGVEVIAECKNGQQLLHALKIYQADILLLDINMPKLNGIEVMESIANDYPTIKVIALSMYRTPSYINRMLTLGAYGYILKDEGKQKILEAIRKACNDEKYVSDEVRRILRSNQPKLSQKPHLTLREQEILKAIAEGYSSREIAKDFEISIHTVKSHRKHIMEKFNTKNMSALIAEAKDLGII